MRVKTTATARAAGREGRRAGSAGAEGVGGRQAAGAPVQERQRRSCGTREATPFRVERGFRK